MEAQLKEPEIKASSLDDIEQRVKRVALLVTQLRGDKHRLEGTVRDLQSRCLFLEKELETSRNSALDQLQQLRSVESGREQERETVAGQIDTLIEKLEGLKS